MQTPVKSLDSARLHDQARRSHAEITKNEGPEYLDGTGAFMRRWWVQRFSATFVTLPFEHHGASSALGSVRTSSRSQELADQSS